MPSPARARRGSLNPDANRALRAFARRSREVNMPVYDYVCNDCHKPFETVLTLTEHDHEKETVTCPRCGSKNVEQEATAFFAVTGRKS